MRARALSTETPALSTVSRSLWSTLVNHGTGSRPNEAIAPCYHLKATQDDKNCPYVASFCVSRDRNIWYCFPIIDISKLWRNCTCSVPISMTYIYKWSASHGYAPCYRMRPHPIKLTSDDRIQLPGWAVVMASNHQWMHYHWDQKGWNRQLNTQFRIICGKLSGNHFPYSDLQVMEEFHLRGGHYLQSMFFRKMQGDRWKNLIRQPYADLHTVLSTVNCM